MFSFLQKINSKKHNHHHDNKDYGSLARKNKSGNLKHKDSIKSTTSVSSFDAVDINDPNILGSNITKQQAQSQMQLQCSNTNISTLQLQQPSQSNLNTNASNHTKNVKSPKSSFSRKSNLSLASLSSGYFTTGRFYDKKKSSPSLGEIKK